MKRELELENKALKEFYIRMQIDIPYNKKGFLIIINFILMPKDSFILILMK